MSPGLFNTSRVVGFATNSTLGVNQSALTYLALKVSSVWRFVQYEQPLYLPQPRYPNP